MVNFKLQFTVAVKGSLKADVRPGEIRFKTLLPLLNVRAPSAGSTNKILWESILAEVVAIVAVSLNVKGKETWRYKQ
jgi:hypothetical protein